MLSCTSTAGKRSRSGTAFGTAAITCCVAAVRIARNKPAAGSPRRAYSPWGVIATPTSAAVQANWLQLARGSRR